LKVPEGKGDEARQAFSSYMNLCPAVQSIIGCIKIRDDITIDEEGE